MLIGLRQMEGQTDLGPEDIEEMRIRNRPFRITPAKVASLLMHPPTRSHLHVK